MVVLGDICLDRQPAQAFVGVGPAGPRLNGLGLLMRGASDPNKREALGDVAALFATSFGAVSADVVEGFRHSPFSSALANGLGRPGLALRDFAAVVRDEVEDMSDGRQSPILVGPREVTRAAFVLPRGCPTVGQRPA